VATPKRPACIGYFEAVHRVRVDPLALDGEMNMRKRYRIASFATVGAPHHDLKHNLYRFDYVLGKFGITSATLGVTAHGLRHEALIEEFVVRTGQQPPVRGGGERASNAYLGAVMFREAGRAKNGPTE
jgi:hypothetical protein